MVSKILLLPIKLMKIGDTTYGANGLLYKVKTVGRVKKWVLQSKEDIEDATITFKTKLLEVLAEYHSNLSYDIKLYQKYRNRPKSELYINKTNEVSKRIWDGTTDMMHELIPKYTSVKNFGKGTYQFLDRGFGYYQLFKILNYYKLDTKLIGVKTKPMKYVNFSGIKHFEQVLNFLNDSMVFKFSTIKKVLSADMKSKWEAGSNLNLVTRIHLMITLLKANIKEKQISVPIKKKSGSKKTKAISTPSKKIIAKSKLHCNKLIAIYNLLLKIKKENITKESTNLDLYFQLYREAVLDLVHVINFYRKIVPSVELISYPGSILMFHNNHITGLSRVEFGYCVYYLISNRYLSENLLWKWTSCTWNKKQC